MSECERKRNDRGKLEFQRNLQNQSFQRACFILHDIKYLLNTAPDDQVCKTGWTNELRKGFLHGLSNLMDILSWMQGNFEFDFLLVSLIFYQNRFLSSPSAGRAEPLKVSKSQKQIILSSPQKNNKMFHIFLP